MTEFSVLMTVDVLLSGPTPSFGERPARPADFPDPDGLPEALASLVEPVRLAFIGPGPDGVARWVSLRFRSATWVVESDEGGE